LNFRKEKDYQNSSRIPKKGNYQDLKESRRGTKSIIMNEVKECLKNAHIIEDPEMKSYLVMEKRNTTRRMKYNFKQIIS
jgi:hypothetical protein